MLLQFASRPPRYRPLGTYKGFALSAVFHPAVVGTGGSLFRIRVEHTGDGRGSGHFFATARGEQAELDGLDDATAERVLMREALGEVRQVIDGEGFQPGADHTVTYRR